MNITVSAIINQVYVSPKSHKQYVKGVDLANGGVFNISSASIDFSSTLHKQVEIVAEVVPDLVTMPGNTRPSLTLDVITASVKVK
jgi:hypothetical protein